MPNQFWPLLKDAWATIKELNGIGRVLPDPTILLKPLEDREAIQSSKIEGTFATARELILFEKSPPSAASKNDSSNEWREVSNYKRALQHGVASNLPLSKRLIRELHDTLLAGVRGDDTQPGEFRRLQVGIRGTRDNPHFVPPPPQMVGPCLDELEKYLHTLATRFDPLIDCYLVHYQFETIHPFRDGNGRVGRLLLALMIKQRCELNHPWILVSQAFDKRKDEYFNLLFNVSSKGDWSSWIEFCLTSTIEQARESLARCQQLLNMRDELKGRLSGIRQSNKLTPIVDLILERMFISVAEVEDKFSITYPTADKYLQKLVEAGILCQLPNYATKVFYSPEIYGVTYADLGSIEG